MGRDVLWGRLLFVGAEVCVLLFSEVRASVGREGSSDGLLGESCPGLSEKTFRGSLRSHLKERWLGCFARTSRSGGWLTSLAFKEWKMGTAVEYAPQGAVVDR